MVEVALSPKVQSSSETKSTSKPVYSRTIGKVNIQVYRTKKGALKGYIYTDRSSHKDPRSGTSRATFTVNPGKNIHITWYQEAAYGKWGNFNRSRSTMLRWLSVDFEKHTSGLLKRFKVNVKSKGALTCYTPLSDRKPAENKGEDLPSPCENGLTDQCIQALLLNMTTK